jgi:hypothetical protein
MLEVIEWLRSDEAEQSGASGADWGLPAYDVPAGVRVKGGSQPNTLPFNLNREPNAKPGATSYPAPDAQSPPRDSADGDVLHEVGVGLGPAQGLRVDHALQS